MKSFDVLRTALARSVSDDGPLSDAPRHASVCVLVADVAPTPHICFIRRAKWDGDPWSEHIAFPGGSRMGDGKRASGGVGNSRRGTNGWLIARRLKAITTGRPVLSVRGICWICRKCDGSRYAP